MPAKNPATTDPDKAQAAVDAQLKEQKSDDTITVPASDAPAADAVNLDATAALRTEISDLQRELAAANAELLRVRNQPAGEVELDLESGAPKWVQRVSGMERKDIAGYVVLPGNVLIVKDKDGREGHRFSFLDHQRDA